MGPLISYRALSPVPFHFISRLLAFGQDAVRPNDNHFKQLMIFNGLMIQFVAIDRVNQNLGTIKNRQKT